jgi:hypothetical protein
VRVKAETAEKEAAEEAAAAMARGGKGTSDSSYATTTTGSNKSLLVMAVSCSLHSSMLYSLHALSVGDGCVLLLRHSPRYD